MSAGDWRWVEGAVDQRGEHLRLAHVDADSLVAVVGPPHDRAFTVQFLPPIESGTESERRILDEVRRELDFYLVELGEPDPGLTPTITAGRCATRCHACSGAHAPPAPQKVTRAMASRPLTCKAIH